MKKVILVICLLLITKTSIAQITKVSLQASGLTCSMCNLSIKKGLEKLDFIAKIEPHIETASYDITFKNNAAIDIAKIKQSVVKAGFSVAQFSFVVAYNKTENKTDKSFLANGYEFYLIEGSLPEKLSETSFMITDKGFLLDKGYKKYASKNKTGDSKFVNIVEM
jgi:copper chaperone CopZ